MARPPASSESGEHILDLASYVVRDDVDTERRDSEDRISFNSIARLVKPSLPPRSFDSLTPVARTDVPPAPAVPGAASTPRRERSRGGLLLKVVSAVSAVALGAGLAAALQADGRARATQPVAAADAVSHAQAPAAIPEPATTPEPAARPEPAPQVEPPPAPENVVADEPAAVEADRPSEEHARERRERERRAAEERERRNRGEHAVAAEPAAPDAPGPSVPAEASEPEASPEELPEHPSREAVQHTMTALLPAIRECAAGQSGALQVEVTVGSSGRVRNALVTGAFAGTPEGSCMARTVRGARFPRFGQESFTVRYPFRL